MSNLSLTEEMNIIESIVVEFNDGIGISDIETVLNQKQVVINRRTLQRRLKKLIQEQRINSKGDSISLIYKPVSPSTLALSGTSSATSTATASVEFYIPVSAEGANIRALVQKPLMYRHPTSYQFDFLADYQPNETYYLPESLRNQLHLMGRTSMSQRPAGTYAREIVDRLLVDLSWASSRLEGNTYSRLDTQNLIQFGQVAQGKDAIETQMILT
jgi:hypothetical protein